MSWYDEFRFYQVRIYAGNYNVSGVCILGVPLPSLAQCALGHEPPHDHDPTGSLDALPVIDAMGFVEHTVVREREQPARLA